MNKNKDPRKPEPSVQGGRSRDVGAVRRMLWREMVFAGGREAGCLHLLQLPKQMPRRPKARTLTFSVPEAGGHDQGGGRFSF